MKRTILILLTALVAFAGSALWSWNWQNAQKAATESADSGGGTAEPSGKSKEGSSALLDKQEAPSVAGRTHFPGTALAEEAAQLAANLRERLAAVRVKENQLADKQKQLDLVYQDIRTERAAMEELQKQAAAELKQAEEILAAAERALPGDKPRRPDKNEPVREILPKPNRATAPDTANVAKAAAVFAALPSARAAEMLQKLADTGKLEQAAQLLNAIPPRQAAKVLSEITTPGLGEKLLLKQQELKKASPPLDPY
jgi:flagellar motility protein MotE (MotC chaperone)